MKKFILLLAIIVLNSCHHLELCIREDPADKFVGKYEMTSVVHNSNNTTENLPTEIVYISKFNYNTVRFSCQNMMGHIDRDQIVIENFNSYENSIFIEYKFGPGYYVKGIFSVTMEMIVNDGHTKEYTTVDLVFNKL